MWSASFDCITDNDYYKLLVDPIVLNIEFKFFEIVFSTYI